MMEVRRREGDLILLVVARLHKASIKRNRESRERERENGRSVWEKGSVELKVAKGERDKVERERERGGDGPLGGIGTIAR